MQLKGKLTGRIIQVLTTYHQTNDGKKAAVDIAFRTQREDAEARFGADFNTLAFATTTHDEEEDCPVHLQDVIKPGSRVKFAEHVITIEGKEVITTPKLLKIEPVEGEETVFATLRIEVGTSVKGLRGKLAEQTGDMITLEFDEKQIPFGFAANAGAGEAAMDGTGARA